MDALGEHCLVSEQERRDASGWDARAIAAEVISEALDGKFDLAIGKSISPAAELRLEELSRELGALALIRWPEADRDSIASWKSIPYSDDAEQALYNLSVALWGVDEILLALHGMRLALDRGDQSVLAMLGEAELYAGDYKSAQRHLTAALEQTNEFDPRLSGLLGRTLFRDAKQFDERVRALLELGVSADDAFAVDLAELLAMRGEWDRALLILRAQSEGGNDQAPIVLGNLLADTADGLQEAETAYRRGIELGDAHSAFNLAHLLVRLGRTDEASEWYDYAASHGDEWAISRRGEHPPEGPQAFD